MNIGDLVLNLGIKGSDKTVGALTNVKKGLSETASMSLEAKAGILGALYALERLFAASGKAGTDLTNFNAITGDSVKTLQQYQYAARQVGVSNGEVEGSFKSLQSVMTKTLLGEGGPKGLARVSQLTGGITNDDIQKFAEKPQLLIQRLQQYAAKEKNVGLRNETLKSFGIGENMIAALSRNAFRPEVLSKAPTYSEKEVGRLDKANIGWSNLGNKIEMAIGHLNASHGGKFVSDISSLVDKIIPLINALIKLADKLKIFEAIGGIFKEMTTIVTQVTPAVETLIGLTDPKKRGGIIAAGKKELAADVGMFKQNASDKLHSLMNTLGIGSAIAPKMLQAPSSSKQTSNNVTIHNTFAHPGTDHKKTGDNMKNQVQHFLRNSPGQTQGA